jgi:pantoate--beta-alanine ligase
MLVLRHTVKFREYLDSEKESGATIGFAPTMGALHDGHLALVGAMKAECEIGVVSIFVNPKQFNQAADLEKYPRTVEEDLIKLHSAACDVTFLPEVEEIYPEDAPPFEIDLGRLADTMEGEFRPGHFDGVAEVMFRLLNIVQPDRLYMGQKDFQQTAIIKHIIDHFDMPVEFVTCPTVREEDGLAMSSRNVRIEPDLRPTATILFENLNKAKASLGATSPASISSEAMSDMDRPGVRPEYFEIVDAITLEPVMDPDQHEVIVACVAAWLGDVRLIDNMVLKGEL